MERDQFTKRAEAEQVERAAIAVLQMRDVESNALHFVIGHMSRENGRGLDGSPKSIKAAIESARRLFPTLNDEQAVRIARNLNVKV